MNKLKVLNLYAGIGGNRKLWKDVNVTAVEINSQIAKIYQDFFPDDKVIVCDAHKYLLEHYKEFDFIWSSPPCPSHSLLRLSHPENVIYPDMKLYQEIVLLQQWYKGKFCVENVKPYYPEFINPSIILSRHYFWCNFDISGMQLKKNNKDVSRDNIQGLSKFKNINLPKNTKNSRLLLRNAVHPNLGLHIFESAFRFKQQTLN